MDQMNIILIVPRWHIWLRPEISFAPCPLLPFQVLSSSSKFLVDGLSAFYYPVPTALMQFVLCYLSLS